MKQIFTIRIEVENIEYAKWIWEGMQPNAKFINGFRTTAISNGDMFTKVNALEEQLEIALDNNPYEIESEEFEKLEKVIEKSEERYLNE